MVLGNFFSNICSNLLWLLKACTFSIKRRDNENEGKTLTLTNLPEDVTIDILMRLPVKSLCCLECVSKTSLNIVGSPQFAAQHTRRLLNSSSAVEVPQLMLLARYSNLQHCAINLQSLKYNGTSCSTKTNFADIVFMNDWYRYEVEFVFSNLFGISRRLSVNRELCYLVNPLRGEVLELPRSDVKAPNYNGYDPCIHDRYGMGFDHVSSTYKIVHISEYAYEISSDIAARVYAMGTRSWRPIQSVPLCHFSNKSVYAYGDRHWLVEGDKSPNNFIVSFDFRKDEFYWTHHPDLQASSSHRFWYDFHLLNLKGSLAIMDYCSYPEEYIKIWVLKNYDKKEWALDYTINMKTFVGRPRGTLLKWGEWENGIFTIQSGVCYFVDLRRGSMKGVKLPPSIMNYNLWTAEQYEQSIFSYTGSMVSLKNYGNLIEAARPGMWFLQ
ncbi:putative F-box domain-containing protein [Rosa chinensis]|uniref:Putative F-box domain-containing protein n=2 Tax=Rosa chinensis TaxID=74649 RepID=A0A2P6R5K7_ROSCH|nr:putative F-box domain-containing protein [Rosa chinensis]